MSAALPQPFYREGERVTVNAPTDRLDGYSGTVHAWHYGISGQVVYEVWLDRLPHNPAHFYESELTQEGTHG